MYQMVADGSGLTPETVEQVLTSRHGAEIKFSLQGIQSQRELQEPTEG